MAQAENALSLLVRRNPGAVDRGKELGQPVIPAGLPSNLLERYPDLR